MKIYFKKIFFDFSKHILAAVFFLVGIIWVTQISRFAAIGAVISGANFISICLAILPYLFFIVLPLGVSIGIIHVMYRYRKIIPTMQSCCISTKQICSAIILVLTIVVMIHFFISFYILPESQKKYKKLFLSIKNQNITAMIEDGKITDKIQNLVIYVDGKNKDGTFDKIFIADDRDKEIRKIFIAKGGKISQKENGVELFLKDGTFIQSKKNKNDIATFSSYLFTINIKNKYINNIDPNTMNIGKIINMKCNADDNKCNKIKYSIHQRLLWPLFSILLPLLFVAMELREKISRKLNFKPTIIASLLALGFIGINFFSQSLVVKQPLLGSIFVYSNVIFLLLLVILMLKSTIRNKHI